jgi:hypothetical protein
VVGLLDREEGGGGGIKGITQGTLLVTGAERIVKLGGLDVTVAEEEEGG